MKNFYFLLISVILFSCKPTKNLVTETIEYTDLDTMVITAPKPDALKTKEEFELPRYTPTYTLRNDLVHTKLDLRFDWPKQQVKGIATLTLKPYFYDTDELELDAKGFDIYSIKMGGKELKYEYDQEKLQIKLDKIYSKEQEYTITIDYLAKPTEQGGQGGSAAIMSDQGLFFINHDVRQSCQTRDCFLSITMDQIQTSRCKSGLKEKQNGIVAGFQPSTSPMNDVRKR